MSDARRRRLQLALAVAALCLVHYVLALTSVVHKSNTYDEIAHLTRGYSYAQTGDFRLGPPHPPLAHYWAALPGLGMNVKFPPKLTADEHLGAWRHSDMWEIGRQFFYYRNLGNAAIIDSLLFRGRAMIALFSVGLAVLTFLWGRRLFGTTGGLIALGLYAFSPTMLAHARLVTTDMAAALFFMCSLTSIWWLLHHVRALSVLASAASLACLFLAKMSAVIIIPVGILLLVLRLMRGEPLPVSWRNRRIELRGRFAQLGCLLVVMVFWIGATYLSIWAAYDFRYDAMVNPDRQREHLYTNSPLPDGRDLWDHVLRSSERAPISPTFCNTIRWLRDHRLFPEAFIYSAAYSRQTARGRQSFLDGETDILGFRSYFPFCFLYKTPLPLMGLMIAAAMVPLIRRRVSSPDDTTRMPVGKFLYTSAPLWTFFIVYWFFSVRSHLNIGHRHIMPTYPVLFVFCGATAWFWRAPMRGLRAIPAILLTLFAIASLWVYPDYLAYFNRIAGGPDNGYKHLVDSSLDWGQDLPGLKAYLDRRRAEGDTRTVFLSYFGSGKEPALRHFGIEAKSLPWWWPKDARGDLRYPPGRYAISATNLQQVYTGMHEWTDDLENEYRQRMTDFAMCMAAPDTPAGRKPWTTAAARKSMDRLGKLMFARLCAHLRHRAPDDMIKHTILVFDVDQTELDAALHKPIEDVRPSEPRP